MGMAYLGIRSLGRSAILNFAYRLRGVVCFSDFFWLIPSLEDLWVQKENSNKTTNLINKMDSLIGYGSEDEVEERHGSHNASVSFELTSLNLIIFRMRYLQFDTFYDGKKYKY